MTPGHDTPPPDRPTREQVEARVARVIRAKQGVSSEPDGLPALQARRRIRKAAGLSLIDMGRIVGVSGQSVRRYELGAVRPAEEHRGAYALALSVLAERVATGGVSDGRRRPTD